MPVRKLDSSSENEVEFQSVLRIRPLHKKEKEDHVVLEPAADAKCEVGAVAVLHPMIYLTSPDGKGTQKGTADITSPNFIQDTQEQQYHFDKVLDWNASQDSVYYSIGLSMATSAMNPLKKNCPNVRNHVVISMGVCNAGKTHTTFGGHKIMGRSGNHPDDGLVPRILESIFSQSKHHVNSKALFAVRMTLLHVENDRVHDLLVQPSTGQKDVKQNPSAVQQKKKSAVMAMVANFEKTSERSTEDEVKIDQDPNTHDYQTKTTVRTCWNVEEAKEILQSGLTQGLTSKFAGLVRANSRGHTLVTIQPVIIKGSRRNSSAVERCGGTVAFLDMAGIERIKKSRKAGAAMRDSIAINSSNAAVMHCLRSIKHNSDVLSGKSSVDILCDDDDSIAGSEISNVSEPKEYSSQQTLKVVPYRQSKVTMLLQPLFSQTAEWNSDVASTTTVVTMILAAYPGHRDYSEKRSLLNDFELLQGIDIAKRTIHHANTGINQQDIKEKHNGRTKDDKPLESNTKVRSDRNENQISIETHKIDRGKTNELAPPIPSAPTQSFESDKIPIAIDDDMRLAHLPPPYAPSCPRDRPDTFSPPGIYSTMPSSQHDSFAIDSHIAPIVRTSVDDFPGVPLPTRLTPAGTSRAIPKSDFSKEQIPPTDGSDNHDDALNAQKILFTSPPSMNPLYKDSPLRPSVLSSQNIQHPATGLKSSTPLKKPEIKSPTRKWLVNATPLTTTLSKAVEASKKKGKKVFEQMDRMVDRTVTTTSESEVHDDVSKPTLLKRISKLEKENAVLSNENHLLHKTCEKLEKEKEELQHKLCQQKRNWRQTNWTEQDENEFQQSRRLRVDDQRLIRSPLLQHIEQVQVTHDINYKWTDSGKPAFSLAFPSHWMRARDLDERDRAVDFATRPDAAVAPTLSRFDPNSGEKQSKFQGFLQQVGQRQGKRFKR